LPPSRLADGGSYEWLSDAWPAPFPAWAVAKLSEKKERTAEALAYEVDNPANLERARTALQNTNPKEDGFKIGLMLCRDLALPFEAAVELFEEWNAGSNGNGQPAR
jgi:hypothetical protein